MVRVINPKLQIDYDVERVYKNAGKYIKLQTAAGDDQYASMK